MVIRVSDLAGWRINWKDKAQNIVELVGELNLGLDSMVFIDDNPTERGRVREALPEVLVPEVGADPSLPDRRLPGGRTARFQRGRCGRPKAIPRQGVA